MIINWSINFHYDSDLDNDSDNDDKMLMVDAIPVILNSIPKDIGIPTKPKFLNNVGYVWLPVHPNALQAITANEPVSNFMVLKTFVAKVKVVDEV